MVKYLQVALTARPPRLAAAVPHPTLAKRLGLSMDWRAMCTDCIAYFGRAWGGAGMVIVPVADDGIPEPVLRALATYDPDFVVPFAAGAGGQATDWLPAPALEQLRRHLSAPTPDEIATAPTMVSGHHTPSYPLTPVDEIDAEAPASLEAEGSDQFRLLLAARVGKLSDIDRRQCVEDGREIEEVVASPGDYGLIHLAYRGVTPGSQLWNDTAFVRRLPLGRSMHSCVYLRRGVSRDVPAAVVVGDDVSDFALALLLDRMYGPGHGMWLPTAMLDGTDGKSAEALLAAAQSLERLVAGRAARVTIPSTSSTGQTLLDARTALSEALGSGSWSTTDDNSELTPFLPEGSINIDDPLDLPMSRPLVLADPHRIDLPVAIAFLEGTAAEEVVPPVPRIAESLNPTKARWHVDAHVGGVTVPPRSATSGLTAEPTTWGSVRAGRDGASWMAVSGFVSPLDIARVHQLTRTVLREPDAYAAVKLLLEAAGYGCRPSNVAGFYLGTIDMWGGLDALALDLRQPYMRDVLIALSEPQSPYGFAPGGSGRRVFRPVCAASGESVANDSGSRKVGEGRLGRDAAAVSVRPPSTERVGVWCAIPPR